MYENRHSVQQYFGVRPEAIAVCIWRTLTKRELLMFGMTGEWSKLRGQILTITILIGKTDPAKQLNTRGLQADFVYVR